MVKALMVGLKGAVVVAEDLLVSTSTGGRTQVKKSLTNQGSPGWAPRPLVARAVRASQIVLPFLSGWVAIRFLQPYFAVLSETRWIFALGWIVQAVVVATIVSAAVAKLMTRFTPLVALLNMSLVFPDSTPSRFGLALRSGGIKKLLENENVTLSNSTQEAAEQAVQLVGRLSKHEPMTRGHTERVRAYAEVIGRQLGLDEDEINGLRWGALLHDVGKLRVPARILNKPGKPDEVEWEILRGHPAAGTALLAPLEEWLGDWLLAAGQHHEKWDGSGYPAGLAGNEISLPGRIVAVADAYDVITSRRSYKEPMSAEIARQEMVRSSGTHFDPAVVRALLEAGITTTSKTGRFGWILELPALSRLLLTTAGEVAATTAVAVVVSTAFVASSGPGGPGSTNSDRVGAPSAAAFLESIDSEDGSIASEAPSSSASESPIETNPESLPRQDEVALGSRNERTPSSTVSPAPDTSDASTAVDNLASPVSSISPETTQADTTDPGDRPQITTTTRPIVTTTTRPPDTTTTRRPLEGLRPIVTTTTRPPVTTTTRPPVTTTTRPPVTTTTRPPFVGLRPHVTTTTQPPTQAGLDCDAVLGGETFILDADLRNCDLSGLVADGLHLVGARLEGANLSGAQFTNFNFNEATLDGATLTNARFIDGSAENSSFDQVEAEGVHIEGFSMWMASATDADFTNATVERMAFTNSDLRDADFSGIQVANSNFHLADVRRAQMQGADLSHIDFSSAMIQDLHLGDTNLTGTNFYDAVGTPTGKPLLETRSTICPDGSIVDVPTRSCPWR